MSFTNDLNSAIANWDGALDLPDFAVIEDRDFDAAFTVALPEHLAEINGIANNPDAPSFENTIAALERAGELLDRAASIFWNLSGANTNDTIQRLERKLAPEMSRHSSAITMNSELFVRIDVLYQARGALGLDAEANRVLELTWKSFVRSGAQLGGAEQTKLAAINERLASLGTAFSQNVLADESSYALVLENVDDLAGLPGFLVSSMAAAAEERGYPGKHAVTLSRSIIEPFLTFSERRDLREEAFKAWVGRGAGAGEHDNRPLVAEMVQLRAEKAALLGYDSFAHFKLDNTMAKTPENVRTLLETMWGKARARAAEEAADLAKLIAAEGHNHAVAPWDWRHYSEKMRAARFDFNEAEVKPYLQLEKMIEAAFATAEKLFGITIRQHKDVQTYHPDVRVFEVSNAEGKRIAIFLGDYFARSSKRSGAWMSSFQDQHRIAGENGDEEQIPFVINVMNFAKTAAGEPILITMDDARTLFHEFGHALHGMLSNVTYPSISGTSVSRDFVELPSQLFEHWLTVPQVLQEYAVHYETGEPIPEALLEKLQSAGKFNKGFTNVEFTSSALVDMAFHALDPEQAADVDPVAFEADVLSKIGMPDEIVMRHATLHFAHVFSGDGYSAGYYSYMWSGVLDSDAYRAFEEAGDPFDPATAEKLYRHIYSSGGSMDPEDAYIAYRGKLPTADALIAKEGLA
ncbi:MAG: M3 family metallopeptidase [Alphaproteobacteria bacterium]|nr:M3 family metallopeptidase [Alphaproteobacteria bacterium]